MIRRYETTDTDALVAIWRAASTVAHPFLPVSFIEQEADNLRNIYLPHAETFVTEVDGNAIGFIAMIGNEIGGLFVDPPHHGAGYGKALVDHVADEIDALAVDVFERNPIGRRFYTRQGFIEIERYTHDGSGEITLKLTRTT